MCMGNVGGLAAAPGNIIGGLWGDTDLGTKTLGAGIGRAADREVKKVFAPPAISTAPTTQGLQQSVSRPARQSLINS